MSAAADTDRPWRCFLAVPIPEELRPSLSALVDQLRTDPALDAEWRWTDPAAWHVTLAFLGAIPPASVPMIVERVAAAVEGLGPFDVASGGIGGFPSARRARVLWYGVQDDGGQLEELARRVQTAAGIDDSATFRPHITLARARRQRGAEVRHRLMTEMPPEMSTGQIPIAGVTLYRSHPGHGPARYEELAGIEFGARVAAGSSR